MQLWDCIVQREGKQGERAGKLVALVMALTLPAVSLSPVCVPGPSSIEWEDQQALHF